jgi:V/A-type H+-transporting ATPase subunit I
MAISSMAKILIACHKSQASQLLEALQQSGICQVLNAEEAMVSKYYPDLGTAGERPRQLEEKLNLISKSAAFLRPYADTPKGLAAALAPRVVVEEDRYESVIRDKTTDDLVKAALEIESKTDRLSNEIENINGVLSRLEPWAALDVNIEQLTELDKTTCIAGLLAANRLADVAARLAEVGAAVEQVGSTAAQFAILVACLKRNAAEVHKILRAADFESVSFEGMTGTIAELISQNQKKLATLQDELAQRQAKAKELARDFVKLEILQDHYANLLSREQTASDCPATERTVILEGWLRKKNVARLEKVVAPFEAAQVSQIEPDEGEEIPVEIENRALFRPFEVVTRLYGMPQTYSIDPTMFLAPFFALFFGLCLTDAGYGILLFILIGLFIWKMQGDKKLMWMLIGCSLLTVVAGALTGGWFGDAVQQYVPALEPLRQKLMWFDPMEKPIMFFQLALILGYIQIMVGLLIGFFHSLRSRDFAAALIDKLCWIVFLNSVVVVIFVGGKAGRISGYVALAPAALILLFSHREGGIVERLGMGLYSLFSSIFYMGDVLSYLRLMALGMVTAGMAMSINVMAKVAVNLFPHGIGIIAAIFILIAGHIFNTAFNALGAFVHTLRLQYAEFFPKFFVSGGREFQPLCKNYRYVKIEPNV